MKGNIQIIRDIKSLISYFEETLDWKVSEYEDIEDITYDFTAADLGLKEEAFAKVTSLKQLRPMTSEQKWGIFFVIFESKHFKTSALRKILSGLIASRRGGKDHAVWHEKDLLFICLWGEENEKTIGIAHFEKVEREGLSKIKMISCKPSVEDFTQNERFERQLAKLKWPHNPSDTNTWYESWSSAFTSGYRETIRYAKELASALAVEARNIRDRILNAMEIEAANGCVHLFYKKFRDTLVHDMSEQQFADMYAQTIVYGLFSARCMGRGQEDFSMTEALDRIPNTNPFLQRLLKSLMFQHSEKMIPFDELEVSNIVDLLSHVEIDSIIDDFNRQTGGGREDPVIHFYEDFLSAYDKTIRQKRGVYYTPQPIVRFMVCAVDEILRTDFGLEDGLASTCTAESLHESQERICISNIPDVPGVQILDPATGTGTFLRETILQIYKNFNVSHRGSDKCRLKEEWEIYVSNNLLNRLFGFELMMAPYAVAHMKLAMALKDTGYRFKNESRLKLYLTNSLENPRSDPQKKLWEDPLSEESVSADKIKGSNGINIVMGNPPYRGISSNNNEWIADLIKRYKYVAGKYFGEKKHWLNDDYVKFIRLAQEFISRAKQGIMAFVNPHGFIDNPTFRGMRWNLLQEYDHIYILNLHGNANKKETAPDGSKDENVFDIKQGISINFFIKNPSQRKKGECEVFYYDLYGLREKKYDFLLKSSWSEIPWKQVFPTEEYYFFKPSKASEKGDYEKGFKLTDLFLKYTSGVITSRDDLAIDFTREGLMGKISRFTSSEFSDEQIRKFFWSKKSSSKYLPGDTREWSVSACRKKIQHNDHSKYFRKITYRPFDFRYIYYSPDIVAWGHEKVLSNLSSPNIALISARSNKSKKSDHFYITEQIVETKCGESTTQSSVFPLFIDEVKCKYSRPNLDEDLANKIASSAHRKYDPQLKSISAEDEVWGPYDIVYYIYALMYSDVYRNTYAEKLNVDFPRFPYPTSKYSSEKLVKLGHELSLIHLMRFDETARVTFNQENGNCQIDRYKFNGLSEVKINKSQSFSGITSEDWEFSIGGYQILKKWLKDRKGLTLTAVDILHYKKMVWGIRRTRELTKQIDTIVVAENYCNTQA